jgi:hypothetical protein
MSYSLCSDILVDKPQTRSIQCDLDSDILDKAQSSLLYDIESTNFYYEPRRSSTPIQKSGEEEGEGAPEVEEQKREEEQKGVQKQTPTKIATVDLHWFKQTCNQIIVKELAIVDESNNYVVFHFKSPFPKMELTTKLFNDVTWLERNYHKIKWSDGDLEWNETIIREYLAGYEKIFTKGTEKAKFLRRLHSNVQCIPEDFLKPDFSFFTTSWCYDACKIHKYRPDGRCALFSAQHYNSLLFKNMYQTNNFLCENTRMKSMKLAPMYTNAQKRNFARYGFFYNGKELQCVYCSHALRLHKARTCCLSTDKERPFNYSIIVPAYT